MDDIQYLDKKFNDLDKKIAIIDFSLTRIEKRTEAIEKRLGGDGGSSLCDMHSRQIESLATTFKNFKSFIYVLFSVITIFLVIIGWLVK